MSDAEPLIATPDGSGPTRESSEAEDPTRSWYVTRPNPLIRRILGKFHVIGVFWYWFHYYGARIFLTGRFSNFIFVTFFFLCLPRHRRDISDNLDIVLGCASRWGRAVRAYKTLWSFADCRSTRYEYLQPGRRPLHLRIDGREHWSELMSRPEGFVLLSGHIGCYDAGGILPGDMITRKIHQVRSIEPDPRAQRFIERILAENSDPNCVTHYMSEDQFPDVRTGIELLKAVRRGELVAMPGDRAPRQGKVVETQMFGAPFLVPEGPFGFARTAGVPLVSAFLFFERQYHFSLVIRRPIEVPRTSDAAADIRTAAEAFVSDLEWAIRRKPHQWMCLRPLFSSQGT
ncbi:MAG: lysophospholipid acyltransferase family protein [Planctomycetota bacterium]